MTNPDNIQKERRIDDERCVDELLAEAGLRDDVGLRPVLLALRDLRVEEVPEPSREVAALMGQGGAAEVIRLEDRFPRHLRKKRVAFTTLAVAASLGIAGGAAAANEDFRNQAAGTLGSFLHSFAPASRMPSPAVPPTPAATTPDSVPSIGGVGPSVPVPSPSYPVTIPAGPPSMSPSDSRPDGGEVSQVTAPTLPADKGSSERDSTRGQVTEPEEARATPPRQSAPPADGSVPGSSGGRSRDDGGTPDVGASSSPAPSATHASRK